MANEDNKCQHTACVCTVSGDNKYCSEYCKEASAQDITEISCSCEHAGCIIS